MCHRIAIFSERLRLRLVCAAATDGGLGQHQNSRASFGTALSEQIAQPGQKRQIGRWHRVFG